MLLETKISRFNISDLEIFSKEITHIYQETLKLQFEIVETMMKIKEDKALAEIEARVYSGINKYFK